MFGPLKKRIDDAVAKLEEQVAAADGEGDDVVAAKKALEAAKAL